LPAQASRSDLLERLQEIPGGRELLAAADQRTHLVGGSVRDLLRAERPRELDVVVEGPLQGLLERLGGRCTRHSRFETASVQLGEARIDLARSRSERYVHPGALPEVWPAPLASDLRRRDFTVNAIALGLAGRARGRLTHVEGALEDLAAGQLRVLHSASFVDDPTRLLRLARYRARLRFEIEPRTLELATDAIAGGAFETVSCARLAAELRLALREPDPIGQIDSLRELGALSALDLLPAAANAELERALALLGSEGSVELLLAGALLAGKGGLRRRLAGAALTARERTRVLTAAERCTELARELARARSGSQLHALLAAAPPEAIALAGALGGSDAAERARRYLTELSAIKLQIGGGDLIAAGVPEGPAVGAGLRAALAARLDNEIEPDAEAELQRALAGARAALRKRAPDRAP